MSAAAAAAAEAGWVDDVEREFEHGRAAALELGTVVVSPPGYVRQDRRRSDSAWPRLEGEGPQGRPEVSFGGEVRHPEVSGEVPELNLPSLKPFSLRGMLMHAMLSYRVASEGVGPGGSGFVKDLYDELLGLSMREPELRLPSSGLGKFPHFLKPPPSRMENQVKVFWDKENLLDGQNWLEGFVLGLSHSMVVVPLLSTNGKKGSIGAMASLKDQDRLDNVLLELILALELLNIEDTSIQAILPVFVGEILDDKFQPFLFGVIDELPDFPSVATNARAAMIMRQLGLPEQVIEKMQARSVRSIVSRVTHMQGVQLSECSSRGEAVSMCASRVLKTVNATIRVVQSAPETFRFQHPMGAEVLDWLGRVSLLSYGPVMASHDLHSIGEIASLANDDLIIHKLCRTHDDMYPKRNKKDSIGDFVKLKKALGNLKGRPEGMLLAERLELFSDREVSYRTCMFSANGVETAMAKIPSMVFIILTGVGAVGYGVLTLVSSVLKDTWKLPNADDDDYTMRYSVTIGGLCYQGTGFVLLSVVYKQIYSTPRRAKRQLEAALLFLVCGQLIVSITDSIQCSLNGAFNMECGGTMWCVTFLLILLLLLLRFRQEYFWTSFMLVVMCGSALFSILWIDDVEWRISPAVTFCLAVFSTALLVVSRVQVWRDSHAKVVAMMSEYRKSWASVDKSSCADVARMCDSVDKELSRQFQHRKRTGYFGPLENLKREEGRYSLRNWGKVRQRTKDIDALFAQASTINETFQDTMWDMVYVLQANDVSPTLPPNLEKLSPVEQKSSVSKKPGMLRAYMEAGPVKRPERAIQKVVRTYIRDSALLTDLVRSTILLEDMGQVKDFMDMLMKQSVVGLQGHSPVEGVGGHVGVDGTPLERVPGSTGAKPLRRQSTFGERQASGKAFEDETLFRLVKLNNRFDERFADAMSGGYRDLQVNVEVGWVVEEGLPKLLPVRLWDSAVSERHICEIQIHLKDIYQVKSKFHSLYVDWRNMLTI